MGKKPGVNQQGQADHTWRRNSQRDGNQTGERSTLRRLLNATIVVCVVCYILYVAVFLGLDLKSAIAQPSTEAVKMRLYLRSKSGPWDGQAPLQLHSAGKGSPAMQHLVAEQAADSSDKRTEAVPGPGTADPAPSDALADILLAAESGIDAAMTDSAGSSDSDASDPAAPAKLDFTSTDSLQDTGSSDEPAAGKGDDEKQQPEITEAVKASGDEKSSSEPLPADSEQKAVEPSAIDVQQAAAQDDRVDNPAESPADAEEDGIAKILAEIEAEDDWLLEGLSFDELQSDEERKAEEALLQSEAADVEDEAAAEDADADFDLMQILEDSKVGPEAEKSSAELPQPDKEPETAEPAQEAAATQGAAAAQAAEAKDTAPVKAAEEASSVPEQGIDELTADDPELLAEEAEIDVGEEAEDPEEEEEEDPFLREFEKSTPELEDEEAFLSGEDSFEDGQQEEEEVEEEEEGGDGLDYISDFEEAAGEAEQDVEDFADIEGEAEQWEGEEEDASLEDEEASEAL